MNFKVISLLLVLALVAVLTEVKAGNRKYTNHGRGRTRSNYRDVPSDVEERDLINVAQALKTMAENMLYSKRMVYGELPARDVENEEDALE